MNLVSHHRALSLATLGILGAAVTAVVLLATAGSAVGAPVSHQLLVYSAQFNCGLIPQDSVRLDPLHAPPEFPRELPAKPANYATTINVHNPQLLPATLVKKAVLTGWIVPSPTGNDAFTSEPEQQFPGGQQSTVQLPRDGAFEIDCTDITRVLNPPGFTPSMSFIKGFVVIYSHAQLDVAAVYTSERVGSTIVYCLLSDGKIAINTLPETDCPDTTVGIATANTGTGLTQDVEYISPKTVDLIAGVAPIEGLGD